MVDIDKVNKEINDLLGRFEIAEQDLEDYKQDAWVAYLEGKNMAEMVVAKMEEDKHRRKLGL
jgi:hypothetical protein